MYRIKNGTTVEEHGTGVDRIDQHRFVPGFRVDGAGAELLPGHFEKRTPDAVLRDAEAGLDEEAERHRPGGT